MSNSKCSRILSQQRTILRCDFGGNIFVFQLQLNPFTTRRMREHRRRRRSRCHQMSPEMRPPSRCESYSHRISSSDEEISHQNERFSYYSDNQVSPQRRRSSNHRHRRRSYPYNAPYPAGYNWRRESENENLLDDASRDLIRRISLATLIASAAVCLICVISRWKEKSEASREIAWASENSFWHDFLYNQFSCSGIGIASVIVALLFV